MSARRRSADLPPGGGGGPPGGGGGWRYTLRVPSWSQAQLPDGETAVFYQASASALTCCTVNGLGRLRSTPAARFACSRVHTSLLFLRCSLQVSLLDGMCRWR